MQVAIVGGSIAGLSAALFLSREGHDVVLIESDATDTPARMEPNDLWSRPGTPHGLQAHSFSAGFVRMMRKRAPDLIDLLLAEGAILRTLDDLMPPTLLDRSRQPGDDEFEVVNARRPFVEWMLRRLTLDEPRVQWKPGVRVRGLAAQDRDGVPHVTGVRTGDGVVSADVVLDASGRRTSADRWLDEIGAKPASIVESACNQLYFGRSYVRRDGFEPPRPNVGFLTVSPAPFGTALVFPGDNGVYQMAVGCLPEDDALRRLREPDVHHAFLRAMPETKPWVDGSEPIGDVHVMAGLSNRLRRLVVDGKPVVTGFHLTGDAWCITNPQFGRGVGHAVLDADVICDVFRDIPGDATEQALALDAYAERMLDASLRDSMRLDRARTEAWRRGMRLLDPAKPQTDDERFDARAPMAGIVDATVWRANFRCAMLLEPPGTWRTNPDIVARVLDPGLPMPDTPPFRPAPPRADLLAAIDL